MYKKILTLIFISTLLLAQSNDHQRLIIFYTNDMHGGITEQEADFLNPDFPPILGGGALAAKLINQYRQIADKNGDAVLLLDAGDIFQGTPLGTKTEGRAIIDYMNKAGYDASCAGNHDFDLGKEVFINLTKAANFPILSANLIDKSTGEIFSYVKPWTIIEKVGLRIGIFGLSTEATENMSFPAHIAGLDFTAEAPAAQRAVDTLRAQNVDIVIGVVHMGLPYDAQQGYELLCKEQSQKISKVSYLNVMELASMVSGIDIIFGGHIHKGYDKPWEDPENHTLCFQNYGNGGNLGMVSILIDRATKTLAGYELPAKDSGLLLLTEDEFWPDEQIYADIKSQQAEVEKGYDEVVGVTQNPLIRSSQGESPMANLICDAMIEATGSDFSFTNFGGIRAEINSGPITPRDLFKVMPFGNTLNVLQMTGEFLKEVMEAVVAGNRRGLAIGGGRLEFDVTRQDNNRITYFEIGGYPVYPQKIYRVVTSDYLSEGNSGMDLLTTVDDANIARTGILLRDAVTEYIQKHSPLKIKNDGRWKKKE